MKTDDLLLMAYVYVNGELAPEENQQRPAECLVRRTTSGCAKRRYTYDKNPDSSIFTGRRTRKNENLITSESNWSVL
ncbi:MAG: hypothetical protein QOJ04_5387 [Caballeronia sp.]|jgi:hypothetical protein|nr:hypothetical protein [Caballeronia sp.]MEA3111246.1 hypothetical protein [Caballeronia sp.]